MLSLLSSIMVPMRKTCVTIGGGVHILRTRKWNSCDVKQLGWALSEERERESLEASHLIQA